MKDTKTTPRVAGIAGKTLRMRQLLKTFPKSTALMSVDDGKKTISLTWGDVLALAGSCTNQAEDKPSAAARAMAGWIKDKQGARKLLPIKKGKK